MSGCIGALDMNSLDSVDNSICLPTSSYRWVTRHVLIPGRCIGGPKLLLPVVEEGVRHVEGGYIFEQWAAVSSTKRHVAAIDERSSRALSKLL